MNKGYWLPILVFLAVSIPSLYLFGEISWLKEYKLFAAMVAGCAAAGWMTLRLREENKKD
jgi:hypothetical protein